MKKDDLINEFRLVYRRRLPQINLPVIMNADDIYNVLITKWSKEKIDYQEEFKLLSISKNAGLLGIYHLAAGTRDKVDVDARFIYRAALLSDAAYIVLAHNHPSGSLLPSDADISLTKEVHSGLKMLGISLWDHLIVTRDSYFSFYGHGYLKAPTPAA